MFRNKHPACFLLDQSIYKISKKHFDLVFFYFEELSCKVKKISLV